MLLIVDVYTCAYVASFILIESSVEGPVFFLHA